MLAIVCGLQGTGKTIVAERLAKKLRADVLRTDMIRRELTEAPQYTEEAKQQVYSEMFSRARELLQENRDVVLDATFMRQENRSQAKKIAEEANTDFEIVEVVCPEDIVEKRIRERIGDASEAGFEQYLTSKSSFERIVKQHIVIDNSGALEDIDRQLDQYFQHRKSHPSDAR